MQCRWSIAPSQPELAAKLSKEMSISPLLAQCLINRGVCGPAQISAFLNPRLKYLSDPFLLPDMDKAVDRLLRARERGENVVVYGDYDVDGVTSCALLMDALGSCGWRLRCHLPHRLDEGYGLTREGVVRCLETGPVALLVAVDCGSTAVETIQWLQERHVDVMVIDHHQVSSPLPPARCLVNPKVQAGGTAAPFVELCSVGLVFKLVHALVKRGREMGAKWAVDFDVRPLLDLVALGTVADMVPLTGENRFLVSAGLERLGATQRPGLKALIEVSQSAAPIGVYAVGFQLAPRLNAAGRLEDAQIALKLLLAEDPLEALSLAQELDARNRERQEIERHMVEQVIGAVRAKFDPRTDYVIVEGQLLWHIGVVGIVASRVARHFHRPAIIFGGDGESWRGSGRSIAGFDLASALNACDDLLVRHGGHAQAAGLTIEASALDAFRAKLNELARQRLTPEQLEPIIEIDAVVSLSDMTLDRLSELDAMEPMGQGNPPIHLAARNVRLDREPMRMGKDKNHLKFRITDGVASLEVVWWGGGNETLPSGPFDLAFTAQVNEFKEKRIVQLRVLDMRVGV
jgi:single-stranded-DNA-specific exonuclease